MSAEQLIERDTCFVSYSRGDERFALRLAEDLLVRGVAIWMDQLNIRASEHWDRAIECAIRGCCCVVVVLSPRAILSNNVADEISLAIDSRKTIIPVMIEPCLMPLRLARMHLIDATSVYELALEQCLAAIKVASTLTLEVPLRSSALEDDEVLSAATRQLATVLGPIAEILVEKAAERAASVADLYSIVSLHIDNAEDRERFLSATPQATIPVIATLPLNPNQGDTGAISTGDVRRVANVLARYLGPIAPFVTRRESLAARSLKDLFDRVAATITCEKERADFCRQLESS